MLSAVEDGTRPSPESRKRIGAALALREANKPARVPESDGLQEARGA